MLQGSTPIADSAKLSATTAKRRENARIIERMLRSAGYDDRVIKAAIVNAVRESGLNAAAVGDGGHSIGLFQLNDWGAGKGLTVEWRKVPANNVQAIIDRELKANHFFGKSFRAVVADHAATAESVAAAWTIYVERPKDKAGQAAVSRSLVGKLWGA